MFSLNSFLSPCAWFLMLFVSFWPWERDAGQVKKSSITIPHQPALLQTIRVALFYEKSKVTLGILGPFEIKGLPKGESLSRGDSLAPTSVTPDPSGIRFGPTLFPVSGLRIASENKEIRVDQRKYHSVIQLFKNPAGSLTVVNEIGLEDYLKGVLPAEVEASWPLEALKAQAVVSRTYALFMNIENQHFPFSLGSDVGSQVYGGKGVENPASNQAVEKTAGEILTHDGKLFPAFFHSTCGGWTARAEHQWKIQPHPSLRGVECGFCQASKFYNWKTEVSAPELEALLRKKGYAVSGIRKITPGDLDLSGRASNFTVEHQGGKLRIPANEFRLAVGVDRLRSTRIRVSQTGDPFQFQGRGWGHGVGMCQWGAKGLAELGYRYQDILRYYYPESEVRNLEEFFVGGTETYRETPAKGNLLKRWYQKVKSYVEEF